MKRTALEKCSKKPEPSRRFTPVALSSPTNAIPVIRYPIIIARERSGGFGGYRHRGKVPWSVVNNFQVHFSTSENLIFFGDLFKKTLGN